MFNSKNLRKINLIFGALTMALFIFAFFDVQWRGSSLVNNVIDIEILALAPIKSILINLVGQDYGQLINNILALNIIWYVVIVFPIWCWDFVRRLLPYEK